MASSVTSMEVMVGEIVKDMVGELADFLIMTCAWRQVKSFVCYCLSLIPSLSKSQQITEAYLESSRTFMMELFYDNSLRLLAINIFRKKSSIIDVPPVSKYTFTLRVK